MSSTSCCSEPKTCCSCRYTPPSTEDECRCGCGYHNGVFQIITSQFLVFIAFMFAVSALGDCHFVTIEEPGIIVRQDNLTSTRLGLLTYQLDDGTCYYYDQTLFLYVNDTTTPTNDNNGLNNNVPPFNSNFNSNNNNNDDDDDDGQQQQQQQFYNTIIYGDQQLEYYINTALGNSWFGTILVAGITVCLVFFVFLYITSYCCSTQVRGVRMFIGLFVSIFIVLLQGMTFLIFTTQWCTIHECTMGRSGVFAILSCSCLFFGGSFFCCMNNYPGADALARAKAEAEAPIVPPATAAFYTTEPPQDLEPEIEKPYPEDEQYEMAAMSAAASATADIETIEPEQEPIAVEVEASQVEFDAELDNNNNHAPVDVEVHATTEIQTDNNNNNNHLPQNDLETAKG